MQGRGCRGMHRTIRAGIIIAGCVALWARGAGVAPGTTEAQSLPADPLQWPLLQGGDLRYVGHFTVPERDGTGRGNEQDALAWGGFAISVAPDGKSLYFGCHDWHSQLARVSIPGMDETAAVLQPCAPVKNLQAINPGDPNKKVLGGSLPWKSKVVVSAYAYYDGGGTAQSSHFVTGTDLTSFQGPYRVGKENPGIVGGYMATVPTAWQSLLGGPALTGQCCIAVIGRSSYGPAISAFNPDTLGQGNSVAGKLLVGYPEGHQDLGTWDGPSQVFNGSTKIGGVGMPAGTRSVLFIGRHGPSFCYGTGTNTPSQHGTPDGQGNKYCYDPTDGSKGGHGFPYRHQVWAYDAKDLADVNAGRKDPWNLRPYAMWTLTEMSGGLGTANITSATFDPVQQRFYIAIGLTVHVYEVARGAGAPNPVVPDDPVTGVPPPSDNPAPPTDPPVPPTDPPAPPGDGAPAPSGPTGWSGTQMLASGGLAVPAVAACGDTVHVAHGNGALYYRRSTEEGGSWSDWQQLGDGVVPAGGALTCLGSTVVLTAQRGLHELRDWQGPQQLGDVWTWVSDDSGATWRAPVKLSSGASAGAAASAIASDRVAAAWMQLRGQSPGSWDVHYRESSDGGRTWSSDRTLVSGGTAAGAAFPTVAAADGMALVAWTESRPGDSACGQVEGAGSVCASVFARRLVNGSWSNDDRLGAVNAAAGGPSAVQAAGATAVTYAATGDGHPRITVSRSTNRGASWDDVDALAAREAGAAQPVLAGTTGQLAAAWQVPRNGQSTTVVRVSGDAGGSWGGDETPFAGATRTPRAAVSNHFVHVIAVGLDDGALYYARRAS